MLLILPKTSPLDKKIIENTFTNNTIEYSLSEADNLDSIISKIKALGIVPTAILGSIQTPVTCWLASLYLFPKSTLYLEENINNQTTINNISSLSLLNQLNTNEAENSLPVYNKTPSKNKSNNNDIANYDDSKLIHQIFLYTSWGEISQQSLLVKLKAELNSRCLSNPALNRKGKKAANDGNIAYQANQRLKKEFKGNANEELITQFIKTHYSNESSRVKHSIQLTVRKHIDYIVQKKHLSKSQNKTDTNKTECILPRVSIKNGIHPNAVHQLPTENEYNVYIDETGSNFSTHNEENQSVGKYVAVVVPKSVQLPPLNNYHATSESAERIDNAMHNILTNKVGVIGFSSEDSSVQTNTGWLSGIVQLARWVVYLLPISAEHRRINIVIEQRSEYTQNISLRILEDMIYNEINTLDDSFKNTDIKLSFAGKENAYLTYADTVALTWGGKAVSNKKRLKQTEFKGYCLLSATDNNLEKLYLMANSQFKLTAKDWYNLCAGLPEDNISWLHSYFNKIIVRIKQDPQTWTQYLSYVKERLAIKNYKTADLVKVLKFLQQSAPVKEALSAELNLHLVSAQLSVVSHQGIIDNTLFEQAIKLINQIKKEDAKLACEGLLRLFSMTTNSFESSKLSETITLWLTQPSLYFGKLNYAKLMSTQGQIYAIEHKFKEAITCFNGAIKIFSGLSDKSLAKREMTQTYCYLLHVYIQDDTMQQPTLKLVSRLLSLFNNDIKQLCQSTSLPYVHHCLVKAFALRSSWFSQECVDYMKYQHSWQESSEHPWPWINVYRNLLSEASTPGNEDTLNNLHEIYQYFSSKNESFIFLWMQLVLQQLTLQFDEYMADLTPEELQQIAENIPYAPIQYLDQLTDKDINNIRAWLNNVLPFNFH